MIDPKLAASIASRVIGLAPAGVERFTSGARHHVFDVGFEGRPSVVVRIAEASARAEMAGAVTLSGLLRPRGVPLPAILGADLEAELPWLVLERLPGTDLGAVIAGLSDAQLDGISASVARAQAVASQTRTAGRYGYAVRPEDAPHSSWSQVLEASLSRSRRRIVAAGLFDAALVERVQTELTSRRNVLDQVVATPFLHDTTTRNVIVTPGGAFSGIVDVDDLCFGDPRFPAALTLAVLTACGGPTTYVSAWMRHAEQPEDVVFRLYVAVCLLDLMSEHGQIFNGNARPSTPEARAGLLGAFQRSLALIR